MPDLWSGGRASRSLSGSFVSGITPRMVLLSDVPFSSRLRTSCMFPGESTLARMVEPGSSTASGVNSSGRRVGIWIALPEDDAMVGELASLSLSLSRAQAKLVASAYRPRYGERRGANGASRACCTLAAAPSGRAWHCADSFFFLSVEKRKQFH